MSNTAYVETQDSPFVQPKRWSGVAITAFVTAFLIAPLGVLLGIVGIFHTSGGKRKGMSLSIAAIPIGLVVSVVVGLMIAGIYMFVLAGRASQSSVSVLKASKTSVAENVDDFYDEFASARLKVSVDQAAFEGWLISVVDKHGSLQQFSSANPPMTPAGDRFIFNYEGQFVNGTALISVTAGINETFSPEIDDIEVDGVSVMDVAVSGGRDDE